MARSTSSWHHTRTTAHWLAAALVAVLVVSVLLNLQLGRDPAALGWSSGIVLSAALVLAAALINLARWARAGDELWSTAVLLSALAALQVVITTFSLVADAATEPSITSTMTVRIMVLSTALGLCYVLPALGTRPPPLAVGAALGLVGAVTLVGAPVTAIEDSLATRAILSVTLWLAYVAVAAVMYRSWPWSELTRTTVTLAVLCLGVARATLSMAETAVWAGVSAVAMQFVAAGLLTFATYTVVRNDLVAHRRHIHALRERLLAAEAVGRNDRSQQHAMRNLVAGITMAAELLEDEDLDEPIRRRLEHRLHVEAEQLCGLFEQRAITPRHDRGTQSPTHNAPRSLPAPDHRARPVLLITGESHVQHQAQS